MLLAKPVRTGQSVVRRTSCRSETSFLEILSVADHSDGISLVAWIGPNSHCDPGELTDLWSPGDQTPAAGSYDYQSLVAPQQGCSWSRSTLPSSYEASQR